MNPSRFHPSLGRLSRRELLRLADTMNRWQKVQRTSSQKARRATQTTLTQFRHTSEASLASLMQKHAPMRIKPELKMHLSSSHVEEPGQRFASTTSSVDPSSNEPTQAFIPSFITTYLSKNSLTLKDLAGQTCIQALKTLGHPRIVEMLGNQLHHLIAFIYSLSITSPHDEQHQSVELQIFEWALSANHPDLQEQAVLAFEYYFPHSVKSQLITQNGNFARVIIEPGPRITRRLLHQVHPSKDTKTTSRQAFSHDYIQDKLLQLGFTQESIERLTELTSKRPMGRRRRYANQLSALIEKFKGTTAAHQAYRDYINTFLKVIPLSARGLDQLNDFLYYTVSIPDQLLEGILEGAPTWTHNNQIEDEIERLIQWHESNLLKHLMIGSPTESEKDILNDIFGENPSRRASQVLNEFFHSLFLENIISSCIFMNSQGRANLRRLICAVYQDNLDFRSAKLIEEIFGIPVTREFWQQWSADHWFETSIPNYGSIIDEISDLASAIQNEMPHFQSVIHQQSSLLPTPAQTFIDDYNKILFLMDEVANPSNNTHDILIQICDTVGHFIQSYKPYSNYLLTLFQNAGHFPGLLHKLSSMRQRILQYLNDEMPQEESKFYFEVTHSYVRQTFLGDYPHTNCLSTRTPMGPNIDGDMYKRPLSPFCANVILSMKTGTKEAGVVAFCDIEVRFIDGEPHLLIDLDYTSSHFIQIHTFRNLIYGFAFETLNIPAERIHLYYDEYDPEHANQIPTLAETIAEVNHPHKKTKLEKAYDVFRDFFLS